MTMWDIEYETDGWRTVVVLTAPNRNVAQDYAQAAECKPIMVLNCTPVPEGTPYIIRRERK